MKANKTIGYLLTSGAVGVFIPYIVLVLTFNYPGVLRQESGAILTQFHQGGTPLIYTWLAFALPGLPLLVAYSLIGQQLEVTATYRKWVTSIGIISGIMQVIGLLRWVFVVPVLAVDYVHTSSPVKKEALETAFILIHQFGGVLLGEHLGQLFTVTWTVFISRALWKAGMITKWLTVWGYMSSGVYLLAQAELFATVIPGFPVMDLAGLIGSTGWLLWIFLVGLQFLQPARREGPVPAMAPAI